MFSKDTPTHHWGRWQEWRKKAINTENRREAMQSPMMTVCHKVRNE